MPPRPAPPDYVPPQLATLAEDAPEGDTWAHEIKFDGYRMQCRVFGDDVRFLSRNAKDWSAKFAPLSRPALELGEDLLIDGEVVVFDDAGRSDFDALKATLGGRSRRGYSFQVFDLLWAEGQDLRDAPWAQRQVALNERLERLPEDSSWRGTEHIVGSGSLFFAEAARLGLEGVVSKRIDAPYTSGRSSTWLKAKCLRHQACVVVGFTDATDPGLAFGALLLGVHDPAGRLVYAGRVGTGFSIEERAALRDALEQLAADCPLESVPTPAQLAGRGTRAPRVYWSMAHLVVEVGFTEWTRDGHLRHPTWRGLRTDLAAADVGREETD